MITTLSYQIKLYDIISNNAYVIDNESTFLDDLNDIEAPYELATFEINNDIFDPSQNTAFVELTYNPGVTDDIITRSILGGNIIQVTEIPSDSPSSVVFVGYVAEMELDQESEGSGTTIKLNCNSLLMQLADQMVVNDLDQVLTLLGGNGIITDFVFNLIPFGVILQFMTTQSLLKYATTNNIIPLVNAYNGTLLPFNIVDNAGIGVSTDAKVYYYASTDDYRLESLLRTIEAYQMICYQDLDGVIQITQPNVTQNNTYSFNVGDYYGTVTGNNQSDNAISITDNTMLYKGFNYKNKSASVANRTFASLINPGVNITKDNDKNTINYVSTIDGDLFTRSQELADSGIFELSKHDVVDLSPNMITNPLLLNVLSRTTNGNSIFTNDVSGNKTQTTITGIYSAKLLAKELHEETTISINMARLACTQDGKTLLPIPFGQTITVLDNGKLAFDTTSYYCYNFKLSYSGSSGTELRLKMCKPYTKTTVWTNINE